MYCVTPIRKTYEHHNQNHLGKTNGPDPPLRQKNKTYYTITQENGVYTITLSGLTSSETEKFIKAFTKANHLTKAQQEPQASAA